MGVMWHLVEPVGFVMERQMLRGIKQRAERDQSPTAGTALTDTPRALTPEDRRAPAGVVTRTRPEGEHVAEVLIVELDRLCLTDLVAMRRHEVVERCRPAVLARRCRSPMPISDDKGLGPATAHRVCAHAAHSPRPLAGGPRECHRASSPLLAPR